MARIGDMLRQAVDDQRALLHRRAEAVRARDTEAAFQPVRKAAEELKRELARVPDLKLTIDAYGVWIDLPDKHVWFSYDPARKAYVGSELDSLWMEGGLREEHFEWPTVEECVKAMVQACARSILLAEAASRISRGR